MNTLSLAEIDTGTRVRLIGFEADRALSLKLRALGLPPGSELEVIQRRRGGIVVGSKANRVALAEDVARRLLVVPVS